MSVIRSVYDRTRQLQAAVKDAARFREIAGVLVKYGFGHVIERMRLKGPLRVPLEGALETHRTTSLYRRIKLALIDLGPTFIKFGQIVSTRPDLIPAELIRELETLQDRVAPLPVADIREQIQRELKAQPEAIFATFEAEPLASASIAQVHRATLQGGEQVVVKVQRPGIRRKIESDLNILYFLARQIENVFPEVKLFNLMGIISEFEHSIDRETDFLIEAANIERFRKNFEQSTTVYIPRAYKSYCTAQVLTMEYVDGAKITQLLQSGEDLKPIARAFLDAAFQMLYIDGFFHGDAHPGNLFILPDRRIALIDFGMVGKLSQEMRERVVDIVFALMREDLKAVARAFFELGEPEGRVDYHAFEAECIDVLEQEVVGRPLAEIQIGALFMKICEGAIKYRIRMPADFTMMFKAMVTAEGLAKMLAPDINVIEEARPYIMRMVAERYSFKRISQEAIGDLRQLASFARHVPTAGNEILRQLQLGKLRLAVQVEDLAPLFERELDVRRLTPVAIVFFALTLAGTLALSDKHFLYHDWPLVALVFYALAAATGTVLFLAWWRSGP